MNWLETQAQSVNLQALSQYHPKIVRRMRKGRETRLGLITNAADVTSVLRPHPFYLESEPCTFTFNIFHDFVYYFKQGRDNVYASA